MRRRSAKKMKLTKRKRQAKQKLGIIAMKKATRRRSAAGL
jgi:hypothetical protein